MLRPFIFTLCRCSVADHLTTVTEKASLTLILHLDQGFCMAFPGLVGFRLTCKTRITLGVFNALPTLQFQCLLYFFSVEIGNTTGELILSFGFQDHGHFQESINCFKEAC